MMLTSCHHANISGYWSSPLSHGYFSGNEGRDPVCVIHCCIPSLVPTLCLCNRSLLILYESYLMGHLNVSIRRPLTPVQDLCLNSAHIQSLLLTLHLAHNSWLYVSIEWWTLGILMAHYHLPSRNLFKLLELMGRFCVVPGSGVEETTELLRSLSMATRRHNAVFLLRFSRVPESDHVSSVIRGNVLRK